MSFDPARAGKENPRKCTNRNGEEVRFRLWLSRNPFPNPQSTLVAVTVARFFALRGRRDIGEVAVVLEALHSRVLQELDTTRNGVREVPLVDRDGRPIGPHRGSLSKVEGECNYSSQASDVKHNKGTPAEIRVLVCTLN